MISVHIPEIPFNNTSESVIKAQEDMSTPKLEALIRESIQNSLDANNGSEYVNVEFRYGDYDVKTLSTYFPEIATILLANSGKFLQVRDYGTVGLTGDIEDSESNYCGLVKKINQSGKRIGDLGGSWGKGKSVFYRQGLGFVIYYSRIINEKGIFESRLNAVFVNWKNMNFHPIEKWTGISLWGGEKIGDYDVGPVYEESYIESVLNCFNVSPYSGKETGTLILIPAVDRDNLLMDVEEGMEHDQDRSWLTSVERCLDFYIQKWFSPRLNNAVEGKPTLSCSVNGALVGLKYNLFKRFQELYNDTYDCSKKNVINLPLKNQNRSYGLLAWKIFSKEDLKDAILYNDPYKLCDIHSVAEKGNKPIVTYTRSPGMFLTFEEPELNNLPETDSESYMLAVFRLNPDQNTLVTLKNKEEMSLEKYVRSTEKSNHNGWKDTSTSSDKFVNNIMRQIYSKVSAQLKSGEATKVSGRRSTDGRFVADKLFPEGGSYLRNLRDKEKKRHRDQKKHKRDNKSEVVFSNVIEKQTLEGVLQTGTLTLTNAKIAMIRLGTYAGESILYNDNWESDIGSKIPISFLRATIKSFTESDGKKVECAISTNPDNIKALGDRMSIRWNNHSEIQIISGRVNTTLEVEFLIKRPVDAMISPALTVSMKGDSDE